MDIGFVTEMRSQEVGQFEVFIQYRGFIRVRGSGATPRKDAQEGAEAPGVDSKLFRKRVGVRERAWNA